MKTGDLKFEHIGLHATFPVRNDNEVTGTITRVRHAAEGTYLELAEHLGVYQTDGEREIKS